MSVLEHLPVQKTASPDATPQVDVPTTAVSLRAAAPGFWRSRTRSSWVYFLGFLMTTAAIGVSMKGSLSSLPDEQRDLYVGLLGAAAVALFDRFRRDSPEALQDEELEAMLGGRLADMPPRRADAVRRTILHHLEGNDRSDVLLRDAFDRAAAEAVLACAPGGCGDSGSRLQLAVDSKVRDFLRSPRKELEHPSLADDWQSSILQYRDKEETLAYLGLLNRDANACGARFSEFWDRHSLTDEFIEDEMALSVIMRDISSLADSVIELNRILQFEHGALGREPRRLGLVVDAPTSLVAISSLSDSVRHFQSASRSLQECLNRYIDVKRTVLQMRAEDLTATEVDDPLLNVMGADIAKALRLFRGLSYSKVFHEQKGALYCVSTYLEAAQDRYSAVNQKLSKREEVAAGGLMEQFDLLRGVLASDLQTAKRHIDCLLEQGPESTR